MGRLRSPVEESTATCAGRGFGCLFDANADGGIIRADARTLARRTTSLRLDHTYYEPGMPGYLAMYHNALWSAWQRALRVQGRSEIRTTKQRLSQVVGIVVVRSATKRSFRGAKSDYGVLTAPMLTLINTNRMTPPIAPIGLDYLASALRAAKIDVELLDLGIAADPEAELAAYFRSRQPELVGLTFRNVDDCFWPSARSFLPVLERDVAAVRAATDAPIVLGGVGYSLFAPQILERTQADFGIRGDGEESLAVLWRSCVATAIGRACPGWSIAKERSSAQIPRPGHLRFPGSRGEILSTTPSTSSAAASWGWKPSGVARAAASTAPTRWPRGKRTGCGIPRSWPRRSASCCTEAWT